MNSYLTIALWIVVGIMIATFVPTVPSTIKGFL